MIDPSGAALNRTAGCSRPPNGNFGRILRLRRWTLYVAYYSRARRTWRAQARVGLMKYPVYPFSAIVGQEEMKLALLLAAVDWRISVLLRGDKGAGKTTTARGLASLLPSPGPVHRSAYRSHRGPSARRLEYRTRSQGRSDSEARIALRGPWRCALRR